MAGIRAKIPRPPIREAVIDFHVSPRDLEAIEQFLPTIEQDFPKRQELFSGFVDFTFGPSGVKQTNSQSNLLGWHCESVDGSRVLLLRTNGIALSHRGAYSSWTEFSSAAIGIILPYLSSVADTVVTRVGTRFVNAIKIPNAPFELDNWFTAIPKIPKELPQTLAGFATRVAVPLDGGFAATIAHALETGVGGTNVVIDIDTYRFVHDSQNFVELMLPSHLENLRSYKNMIFFSLVTDQYLSTEQS
jgi:uncharacterized protein (TIGR04255 family)